MVGAAALYPVAGCGLFDDQKEQSPPPAPDPLTPLLAEALLLAGRHEAAIAAFPVLADRLTPVVEAHREHAAALTKLIKAPEPTTSASASPSPEPLPADVKGTLAALRSAEQKGQQSAAQACQSAPAERAALLGSIAAARATHLEVVR